MKIKNIVVNTREDVMQYVVDELINKCDTDIETISEIPEVTAALLEFGISWEDIDHYVYKSGLFECEVCGCWKDSGDGSICKPCMLDELVYPEEDE